MTFDDLFASKWISFFLFCFVFEIRFVLSVLSHLFVSNNKIHDDEKFKFPEALRILIEGGILF